MKDIAKWVVYGGIFLIPAIVLIISNSLFFPFITGKNFAFRIIVEIIFAAWIILALYDVQYRPRFSWIIACFAGLLGVMFFANILGEHPQSSFWSNFERMEGYVTLVHVFLYVLVVGSVMKTRELWDKFFLVALGAALVVAMYAFAQLSGNIAIHQGGLRLDGTLGNAAYMAVYTLFLTFITLLMLFRAKSTGARYAYGALILVFVYFLIQTATRGTMLGFIGGSVVTAAYIALFSRDYPSARTYASWAIGIILVLVGGFIAAKDTDFVQQNPYLSRIASISLSEGEIRFTIWRMAFEGVKERPLLGWGQGNYNYVFNTHFIPELHRVESWYDRVHNIVMDWLVAGGFLGAFAYFSILGAAVWYVLVRPLMRPDDQSFTLTERGVLIGLLTGYTIHNMFVFDNIVSYIFYGAILAYIHSRVTGTTTLPQGKKIDTRLIEQVAIPTMVIALLLVIYTVNVPAIRAAGDIIDAFRATDPDGVLEGFERALARDSFATQEIREQMMQRIQTELNKEGVSPEFRERALARVEEELLKQSEEKPGDARVEVFLSAFYRANAQYDKAAERLALARTLSPQKQVIMFEQGHTEFARGNTEAALAYFKEAYESSPHFFDVRVQYANAALYAQDRALFESLIATEEDRRAYALNDSAIQAVYSQRMYPELIAMFETRVAARPQEAQERANLAYVLDESGDSARAIEVLEQASRDIPSFKTQADQFIAAIRARISSSTPIEIELQ